MAHLQEVSVTELADVEGGLLWLALGVVLFADGVAIGYAVHSYMHPWPGMW